MALSLNNLKPAKGSAKRPFIIGRGHGSGMGKTSGRGTKGQAARSGVSGLRLKGMRALMLSMPKARGFTSQYTKDVTITLTALVEAFPKECKVNLEALHEKKFLNKSQRTAKIVSTGSINVPLHVFDIKCSPSAKALIEKAGGSVAAIKPKKVHKHK
ncbi:MAG: 50S ribosomal protein L15 [bacterium]